MCVVTCEVVPHNNCYVGFRGLLPFVGSDVPQAVTSRVEVKSGVSH